MLIRGVDEDFQITEKLASVCSMHETATSKDLYRKEEKKLKAITFNGTNFDLLRLVEKNHDRSEEASGGADQLKDFQILNALSIHCIMHQQALCWKDLDISCVLKPVVSAVSFIQGHALNHCQFQAFLEDIGSDFCDLPYHTAVRWLSCDKVLCRLYKLRNKMYVFLTENDRADPQLAVKVILFFVNITSHMNELNL